MSRATQITQAQQIRDEVLTGANTATRIGALLVELLGFVLGSDSITDTLTSDDATKALSAKQGKVLKLLMDGIATVAEDSTPAYDPAKTYQPAPPSIYVTYGGLFFEFVSGTAKVGITPGTNATIWKQTTASAVISHQQGTDAGSTSRTWVQGSDAELDEDGVIFWAGEDKKAGFKFSKSGSSYKIEQTVDAGVTWTEVGAGGSGSNLPTPTDPADDGKSLIASAGQYILAALTATAGGTVEGALQFRDDITGLVTGTNSLRWINGTLNIGDANNPGLFKVFGTTSEIGASLGQSLVIWLNDNLEKALEYKIRGGGTILSMRTLIGARGLLSSATFSTDSSIGAPYSTAQAEAATTGITTGFFKIPGTADDVELTMPSDGNFIHYEGLILGYSVVTAVKIVIRIKAIFQRTGTVISELGAQIPETIPAANDATAIVLVSGDNLKIQVTPPTNAGASEVFEWKLTSQYMKI